MADNWKLIDVDVMQTLVRNGIAYVPVPRKPDLVQVDRPRRAGGKEVTDRHVMLFLAVVCVLLMALNVRATLISRDAIALGWEMARELEVCRGYVREFRQAVLGMKEVTDGLE